MSRDALVAAVAMFPEATLTVFHAHGAPGSWAADNLEQHRAAFSAVAQGEVREFLARTPLPETARSRLAIEVQFGDPAKQLAAWTEAREVELVVVGTRGRGWLGELFLGSVAKRVLAELSCDVLVVPPRSR